MSITTTDAYRHGYNAGVKHISEKYIEELEELKTKIGTYYLDCSLSLDSKECKMCNDNTFKSILKMVDDRKSEMIKYRDILSKREV